MRGVGGEKGPTGTGTNLGIGQVLLYYQLRSLVESGVSINVIKVMILKYNLLLAFWYSSVYRE